MNLYQYEGKIVRVIDVDGRAFTGIAVSFPVDYGFHEFNRDVESIKIEDYAFNMGARLSGGKV